MTRPDSVNGPFGSPTQQWGWPASYSCQQSPTPAPGTQPQYQGYQQPDQQQPYQQSYPPYPPQQAYSNSWGQPGRPFPSAPMAPAAQRPRTKTSVGKLVALALAGFLLVGLVGGAILYITGTVAAPGVTPAAGSAATPVVTMSLPPVIDGHPQIDNEYSRQLVDAAKQQLAAVTSNPVVGMYGDPGQPPAFVIIAGTTNAGSPDMVLTGMAAGFQQSLGSQELNFVDQPAGPLGGTMRCAEHSPMATCMWSVDGAFGMNMVFQQDLAQAAATTLRVREAIETHTA
jgi:hypothetical protein